MKKSTVILFAVICLLAVIGMIVALILTDSTPKRQEFVPPEFESAAEVGAPDVSDASFTKIAADGMTFSAHVCGRVVIDGEGADVYFTNDEGNDVWLKLRVLDERGNLLAETGLLKPNEFVRTIRFTTVPQDGAVVRLKIMAYEPDAYYSAGAVTLNTTTFVK